MLSIGAIASGQDVARWAAGRGGEFEASRNFRRGDDPAARIVAFDLDRADPYSVVFSTPPRRDAFIVARDWVRFELSLDPEAPPPARLTGDAAPDLLIAPAERDDSRLDVLSGAWDFRDVRIGLHETNAGTLGVDGVASAVTIHALFEVGGPGTGTVSVEAGGLMTARQDARLGLNGGSATVLLDGFDAALVIEGDLTFDAGVADIWRGGLLVVNGETLLGAPGRGVEIAAAGRDTLLQFDDLLTTTGDVTMDVQRFAEVIVGDRCVLGAAFDATTDLRFTQSYFTLDDDLIIGDAGAAMVTLAPGALVAGDLVLGADGGASGGLRIAGGDSRAEVGAVRAGAGRATLELAGGAWLEARGDLSFGEAAGGEQSVRIDGRETLLDVYGDVRFGAAGPVDVQMSSDAVLIADAVHLGCHATFSGAGRIIADLESRGRITPTGRLLNIRGGTTLTDDSVLHIDVAQTAGRAAATPVLVTGVIRLGGELVIDLPRDFDPAIGAPIEVLRADAVTGDFSSVTIGVSQRGVSMRVKIQDRSIILEPIDAGIDADLNQDGRVDHDDLAGLLGLWGDDGGRTIADLNRDGRVDADDLTLFFGAWPAPTSTPDEVDQSA